MFCVDAWLNLLPFLPTDPQISPGKKTGNGMSGQVMDPSLLPQLSHDGVNERKASPSLQTQYIQGWWEYFTVHLKVLWWLSTSPHAARYSELVSQSTWVHTGLSAILLKLGIPTLAV